MSYSFSIRAADKAAAKAAVEAKVAEIVAQQPVHAADAEHIKANAFNAIDILVDAKEGCEVAVSANGYVSGSWQGQEITELTSASIAVSVCWAQIPVAA